MSGRVSYQDANGVTFRVMGGSKQNIYLCINKQLHKCTQTAGSNFADSYEKFTCSEVEKHYLT